MRADDNDDGGRDAVVDAAASDDDDDRTLRATPPPDVNDHLISITAVAAEPVTNDQARGSATDSTSSGGQSLSNRSATPNVVNRMDQPWPSMYQQRDRSPSSPSGEIAEGLTQNTPYAEAPAAAGHVHDVFAEYEKRFGVDSRTRKSGRPKGRSSPSRHPTNPVCDETPSLDNPSQQSIRDEGQGVQVLDRTITASPVEVGSDGLSAGCLTNIERDGGGRSSAEMEDQQRQEPTPPNPPSTPSRKRSGPPTGSHAPSRKRLRGSSRVLARKAREARETLTRSDSHEERLRHAFPRHCRDKDWDVVDLRVSVGENGALTCELLWAPTTVSVSTLKGALLERAEEVVKRDHSVETWDKWLDLRGKTGRRCRGSRANLHGRK